MFDCPGCAERREQIKKHMDTLKAWMKDPLGKRSPTVIHLPPTPQISRRPNIAKKEKSP